MALCTDGMCKNGRAAVAQMQLFFNQIALQGTQAVATNIATAGPAVKTAAAFVAKWLPTVNSVAASLHEIDGGFSGFANDWVPFGAGCCSVLRIGVIAQTATTGMAADSGVTAPPLIIPQAAVDETEGKGDGFFDKMEAAVVTGVKIAAIGSGVLILLFVGSKVVKAWPKSAPKALPSAPATRQLSGRGRGRRR